MNKEFGAIKVSYDNFTKDKFVKLANCIEKNNLTINVINMDKNVVKMLLSGSDVKTNIKNILIEYSECLSTFESIEKIDYYPGFKKELIELFGFDVTHKLELDNAQNFIIKHINLDDRRENSMNSGYATIRMDKIFLENSLSSTLYKELEKNNIRLIDRKDIKEKVNDYLFDLIDARIDYVYVLLYGEDINSKLEEILERLKISDKYELSIVKITAPNNPFKSQIHSNNINNYRKIKSYTKNLSFKK